MSDTQNKDILKDAVEIFSYLLGSFRQDHTQYFRITMFEVKDGERSTGKFTPCLCELIYEDDNPAKEIIDIRPICEILAAPISKVFKQYEEISALKTCYSDIVVESENKGEEPCLVSENCLELENLLEHFSKSKNEKLH